MVVEALNALEPQYEFVLKVIKTKGDEGKLTEVGAFTKGIQRALLNKEIDIVSQPKRFTLSRSSWPYHCCHSQKSRSRDALIANSGSMN